VRALTFSLALHLDFSRFLTSAGSVVDDTLLRHNFLLSTTYTLTSR
jgi:hypothetical protein